MSGSILFGILMLMAGTLLAVVSWVWAVVATFSTGILWGIGYLFFPFVWIFFLFFHWKKAVAPFVLGLCALILVFWGAWTAYNGIDPDRRAEALRAIQADERLTAEQKAVVRQFTKIVEAGKRMSSLAPGSVSDGQEPSGGGKWGYSSLREAVRNGDLPGVQTRLAIGEDIDVRSETGETALMEAVALGHGDIVKFLLESGANRFMRSESGKSALDIARENKREDLVKLLE